MSENRWYKVEFYGGPASGHEPTIPADWDDQLVLAGKLMDLFGFERLDGLSLVPYGPKDET